MLKKQKLSLTVLTLLLLSDIGILGFGQYFFRILFSFFLLVVVITFLPLLRQKINNSFWATNVAPSFFVSSQEDFIRCRGLNELHKFFVKFYFLNSNFISVTL